MISRLLIIVGVILLLSACSTAAEMAPHKPDKIFNQESYSQGGFTYITSQGRWLENREGAKRSAIREAQKTYAEQKRSFIRGYIKDLENQNGRRNVQNYNFSEIKPVNVPVEDFEVILEETQHENSWMWNQQWRFKLRVKIEETNELPLTTNTKINYKVNNVSQSNNMIVPDGKYYSIPKSSIQSTNVNDRKSTQSFATEEDFPDFNDELLEFENEEPPMSSQDKLRYTIYGTGVILVAYIVANPWILWFL